MNNRYCKLLGGNKIYMIEKIDGNKLTLKHANSTIITDMSKVILLDDESVNLDTSNSKVTITVNEDIVPNEIMLRHMYKEEALSYLEKYIDRAIVAKLGRVRIIHGKQGGVLRKAVHEYLSTHPNVKEYYLAEVYEGSYGATIAILGRK